jgi:hypothetical protein
MTIDQRKALLATIRRQGGRYQRARRTYVLGQLTGATRPCTQQGCRGTEGVAGAEAMAGTFLAAVDHFEPGDFPCRVCGSTGLLPAETTVPEQPCECCCGGTVRRCEGDR